MEPYQVKDLRRLSEVSDNGAIILMDQQGNHYTIVECFRDHEGNVQMVIDKSSSTK